jgi:hypothetical protein
MRNEEAKSKINERNGYGDPPFLKRGNWTDEHERLTLFGIPAHQVDLH